MVPVPFEHRWCAALVCAWCAACAGDRTLPACPSLDPDASADVPVLIAAGDISACDGTSRASDTAALVDGLDGTVITLGDNAYLTGSLDDYLDCYDATWGRFRARTRPTLGNHEVRTAHAGPYFAYFCGAAGEPFQGYYSFDLGGWHVVSLNSNCEEPHGGVSCAAGGEQAQWLRRDLAAHPAACMLAYFHHPRFTSGHHGDAVFMEPIWQVLYDAGADVVLSGHSHSYERFAPQTPQGKKDSARGIRELVVGTGGADLGTIDAVEPNSEVHDDQTHGVLELTLRPTGYDWKFLPVAGESFTDEGSDECH